MGKSYTSYIRLFSVVLFLTILASCKKDKPVSPGQGATSGAITIGLYEVDSSIYRRIYIPITKIGTQNLTYYGVFDTGSTGMTIDANGILPASMITANGITLPGDSVVVNGITVTSLQAVVSFGNTVDETQEFGNLAYAPITIGDQKGNIVIKRVPLLLYYKVMDITTGQIYPPHSNDIFGVGPGVSFANSAIASPLSYITTGAGVTSGFKLAMLNNSSFSINGTFVPGLLTVGLLSSDLAASSGFVMHPLTFSSEGGYSPNIPATINYNGQNVAATVLFDTGTPAISIIANNAAAGNIQTLPANTNVTLTTASGFSYSYSTGSTSNLTQVAQPSYTGDFRTIFSIDFFTSNEYLLDYANHRIGLKND